MTGIEKEITDIKEIETVLQSARVCRLALIDKDYPYIIPMCFGYNISRGKLEIYFRCDEKGKKMDLIRANSKAAFEVDKLHDIIRTDDACGFALNYHSITGTGTIESITGIEKITGLNYLMKKYFGGTPENKFPEQLLNSFAVLKFTASEFCCREHNPV